MTTSANASRALQGAEQAPVSIAKPSPRRSLGPVELLYGSKTVPDRTVPYLSVPTSPGAVSTLARKLGGRNRPLSAPCLQSYDPACCGCSQPALPTRFGKVTDKHLAILVLRDGRPSSSRPTAAACAKRDQDAHGPVRRGQVALQGESCLLTSPHTAWAELELSPRHRAPRDRGGTALLLRRPRLRRRGRHHPRPHRTFLALASRRCRVSHHRSNCRLAPPATAFNPPECRCPSRPPSELSLPRRGHPPELTAAACRVGSLRGPIAPGDRPRAAVRAVVFVRVVWCISFEVQTLEFKRGEPCALSYRVVRSCRGGAVYEKYMMVARCSVGCVVHNYVTE